MSSRTSGVYRSPSLLPSPAPPILEPGQRGGECWQGFDTRKLRGIHWESRRLATFLSQGRATPGKVVQLSVGAVTLC
eukprot:755682-Hanusia_phi.AAC.2